MWYNTAISFCCPAKILSDVLDGRRLSINSILYLYYWPKTWRPSHKEFPLMGSFFFGRCSVASNWHLLQLVFSYPLFAVLVLKLSYRLELKSYDCNFEKTHAMSLAVNCPYVQSTNVIEMSWFTARPAETRLN